MYRPENNETINKPEVDFLKRKTEQRNLELHKEKVRFTNK